MQETIAARSPFALRLKQYRDRRRWSQERLASEAAMAQSLVSRLESGQRRPTAEAIGKLAAGLGLTLDEWDGLRVLAGYMPLAPAHAIADEPDLVALYLLLTDDAIPPARRDGVRAAVAGLARAASALLR